MSLREIQQKIARDEREVCARIAEAVAHRLHLAGDEGGANAAHQVAKLIREDGIPEIREAYRRAQRKKGSRFLAKGPCAILGTPSVPNHVENEGVSVPANLRQIRETGREIEDLRQIDPSWSGQKPQFPDPLSLGDKNLLLADLKPEVKPSASLHPNDASKRKRVPKS